MEAEFDSTTLSPVILKFPSEPRSSEILPFKRQWSYCKFTESNFAIKLFRIKM